MSLNPPRNALNATNTFFSTDGVYTEAIHTDVLGSGLMQPVANTDFYPNGGLSQPGCEIVDWECSRDRAFLFFAESLVSGGFTGRRCDVEIDADVIAPVVCESDSEDTLPMGGLTDKAGSFGVYYVPVNEQSPYSQG
ncbi:pancreatic triacylglycerol lipase-like [Cydia amplana]|uniref:pancreatic triacylglycerol lipase-like n=1 Tax=Cydia amplana TaxID=1869771 RepID=UPI002FE6BE80